MISAYFQDKRSSSAQTHHVTCIDIDRIKSFPVPSTFLTVGYVNGYEIHRVVKDDPALCLECSFTGGEPVSLMRLLPASSSPRHNLAIVYSSSPTVVRFIDLVSNESYHLLRMTSPVIAIRASLNCIVITVKNRLHIYNPETLEEHFSTACSASGICALGDRWVAYNLPSADRSFASSSTSPLMGQVWSKISNMGQEAFDNLVMAVSSSSSAANIPANASEPNPLQSPSKTSRDIRNGIVVIRDVVTCKVISTVEEKSHAGGTSRPVELVEWSNCGTILMTTSGNGHQICIYEISSKRSDETSETSGVSFHLKKVLNRGLTPAVITSLSVDNYAKFAVVCSSKGTVHLFPLSANENLPEGTKIKLSNDSLDNHTKTYFDFNGKHQLISFCRSFFNVHSVSDDGTVKETFSTQFVRPINGSPNLSLKPGVGNILSGESSSPQTLVDVKTCPDLPLPLWLSPQLSFWNRDVDGQLTQLKVIPPGRTKIDIQPDLDLDEYTAAVDKALLTPISDESSNIPVTHSSYFMSPKDGFVQIVETGR